MFDVLIVLCLTGLTIAQHDIEFEFSRIALQMPESLGRREVRKDWMIVSHLHQGDELRVRMCIDRSTSVIINDIVYSNDGQSDTVDVSLDGVKLGKFQTLSQSDWGRLWSTNISSGYIGQSGMLPPGQHELSFKITNSADCYGVELWSFKVRVFIRVDPSKFWCGTSYTLAERTTECGGTRVAAKTQSASLLAPASTTTPPPTYVKVTQRSQMSNCYDKKNVKVMFATETLDGTYITFKQGPTKTQTLPFAMGRVGGRWCDREIWQLGEMDNSNNEFNSIYLGKSLTINLTNDARQEFKFPMKIIPFTTTDLVINFDMPEHVDMKEGSAYFALGLVNLTKPVNIGLRYFDHTIGDFSPTHFVTFTPNYQIFGWNIPNLGKTDSVKNTFHLHFESEANVIMFDFLKLLYTKRDERKRKSAISRRGLWKVNGLRFSDSKGMTVNVDNQDIANNMEDAIIMHQIGRFARYKTVLRVHATGLFYPYKTFLIPENEIESALIDVSGFHFSPKTETSSPTSPAKIQTLFIDTVNNHVKATFVDGSVLQLGIVITDEETKIEIINYTTSGKNNTVSYAKNLVFTSTYVNDYYAAANTLQNEAREQPIMSDVSNLSGGYNFTIKKTSPSNMYYANNIIHVNFPK